MNSLNMDDLRYLAEELPNEVRFFKYSGDFSGERACILRQLKSRRLADALRKRLQLELLILDGIEGNYTQTMEEALEELREISPALRLSDLESYVENGWIDHIIRNGKVCFEESACANLRGTHAKRLYDLSHPDSPMAVEPRTRLEESIRLQHENGSDAVRFTIEMHLRPDDTAVRAGETLRVWLPFPAVTPEQSEITLLASSHPVRTDDVPVRTAYIEATLRKGEDAWVRYSYVNRAVYVRPDPDSVNTEQPDFCTGEEYPHIRFTPLLRELAEQIAGNETNPLCKARAAYDWITKNVMYSYVRPYISIENLSEYAVLNGHGDCGLQAILFVTLCRIMGIPAQWQSGCDPDFEVVGSHDWTRFYVAPFGWLHCDPSFGGAAWRRGDLPLHEHYAANIDPFRMVTCTCFQQPFSPAERYIRSDPYDNQRGEAEYGDGPVSPEHTIRKRILVKAERIR